MKSLYYVSHVIPYPESSKNVLLTYLALAETGSHSDATYPVRSRINQQLPCVSDDDEMEDSVSLYEPPSISPSSSGQMAPPTPLAAPSLEPPQVRRKPIQTDFRKQRKEDLHS